MLILTIFVSFSAHCVIIEAPITLPIGFICLCVFFLFSGANQKSVPSDTSRSRIMWDLIASGNTIVILARSWLRNTNCKCYCYFYFYHCCCSSSNKSHQLIWKHNRRVMFCIYANMIDVRLQLQPQTSILACLKYKWSPLTHVGAKQTHTNVMSFARDHNNHQLHCPSER